MSKRIACVAAILAAMIVTLTAPAASAATLSFNYFAYSGGTVIRAVGTTISSDLTSQSGISGNRVPASSSNRLTALNVEGLAAVGAVQTSTVSSAVTGGVKLTSYARTTGVNLLNGTITADAVETITTTTGTEAGGLVASANTKFVNLKIVGVNLPVNIPKNYKVSVPGLATIVLNASIPTVAEDGALLNQGYGVGIFLLRSVATAPASSTIVLNPTYAAMAPGIPTTQPQVGGFAYATQVLANVGEAITGQVGKTGSLSTAPGSSGGRTVTNSTASVNVPGVLTTGLVKSTSTSTARANYADVTNVNQVAGINVLGGVVTADAIKVTAHSKKDGATFTRFMKLEFVNLKVAGQSIPVTVGPNTRISVPGVGTVVINDQLQTFNANRIRGVYIKLLEPNGGLQAGAEIELAVAASWITQPQ